ncbi:FAD-binding and (Fe-S)-binding domain-containing protein [Amycolatopsis jejuensis]|uniref:FAD-binding and (Fe-S)-binding domain-containing protein n=1 Tax=Amycolatopsis jejuensis TaxID=330084 RepID=UPI0005277F4F|nr:FAD-binding and (Fe-S)-binding domain-containing protein [Amycolatopsis jejuensis]
MDATTLAAVEEAVPGGVSVRETDRFALAHDASHYLLIPDAIVTPRSAGEVSALLRAATAHGVPLTFRSGGTSLSGQAGSAHLLVDTRRRFTGLEVLDDGQRVRVGPGVTVRAVNTRLARYGRKLGPDPASEAACTIGGVVANNSSGMACGTEQNTYRTLESAVLVLPSGAVVDTARPLAHPELAAGLLRLRDRVRADPRSVATIRRLFALKNTMGYGVNAFLDHDDPAEILLRLVVGSEGTLAFVASATFRTVPLHPHRATGLLLFEDLYHATEALPELISTGLRTIELMDAASLRVAQQDPRADATLRAAQVDRHAALLVEYQESTPDELAARVEAGAPVAAGPVSLTTDASARAALWQIRKGLYAAVAGNRPAGTTALLEDIAVPVEALAGTCTDLIRLFDAHDYHESVIFGHAKDGNIHFLLNETLDETTRYERFTEEMVQLVLDAGGTLKAEHGTGRIMAPFVRRQYGDELYDVMVEVKRLLDPAGVLNADVVLTADPGAHVRHLKTNPPVEEEADRCVECGYCEPVCPSRDLTLTPRQRIVLRREIARAEQNDPALAARLNAEYTYDGVQTCAADGMCQTACPVLIDTGQLVKRLRAEEGSSRLWTTAARHWKAVTRTAAFALDVAQSVPPTIPEATTKLARRASEAVPLWTADLPRGGPPRRDLTAADADLVFLPSCVGSMFGGAAEAFLALCAQAGLKVRTPTAVASLCCGTPWKSKGQLRGYAEMKRRVVPAVREASEDGALPVVIDASSCTEGLSEMVPVIDAVRFTRENLLPHLEIRHRLPSLTLHPTCSSVRLGLDADLAAIANAIADEVRVPDDWGCCGFAGDRGMLHPELTASATAAEAAEVTAHPTTAYASLNRTCEIGLTRSTGRPYRHVLELVHEAVTAPE